MGKIRHTALAWTCIGGAFILSFVRDAHWSMVATALVLLVTGLVLGRSGAKSYRGSDQ